MLSTPREGTITLGSVSHLSPTPSKRPILILLALGAAALLALGVGLGVALSGAPKSDTSIEQGAPNATSSPSPQFRPAIVGQAFEITPWRITVTSIRCGTAHELLAQDDDNGQEPTDRVCVAALSYANIDKVPHRYGSGFDGSAPQAVDTFLGFSGESAYTGHTWLRGEVNPGITDTNQMIFLVPPGVSLTAVQIGDVLVKA